MRAPIAGLYDKKRKQHTIIVRNTICARAGRLSSKQDAEDIVLSDLSIAAYGSYSMNLTAIYCVGRRDSHTKEYLGV